VVGEARGLGGTDGESGPKLVRYRHSEEAAI